MRLRTSTAVTACALAAGLTVAGCSSSGSGSSSAGSATTQATAQATTQPTPAATASSAGASSTARAAGTAATQGSAPHAQAAVNCQPANLTLAFGGASGGTGQQTLAVDLTNKGSSACTMEGFPGVNLVGSADGKQDYTWPLLRSSASYSRVTLQPGKTAHFDLRYIPGVAGDGINITVATVVITPPNDYTHAELTWDKSVLLQDAATHPGTYVMPVAPGA